MYLIIGPSKVYNYFWEGYHHNRNHSQIFFVLLFLFKTIIENNSPHMPLEALVFNIFIIQLRIWPVSTYRSSAYHTCILLQVGICGIWEELHIVAECREGGEIGMFITLVPSVFLFVGITTLGTLGNFDWLSTRFNH